MEHKKGRRFGSLLGYLTQTKATTDEKQLLEEKITEFTQIVEQLVKSNQELNKKVSDLIHLLSVNDHTHRSEEEDYILVPQSPTYSTDDEICSHNPVHETLVLRGTMRAHTDSVTAIAIPLLNSDIIVTASRDKSIIVWKLDGTHGVIQCQLTGHSHSVQDVALSFDGRFAVSASWDGELRLWELATATTVKRFVGHTEDVMSVALSVDTHYIVSASRDCSIKLWNTLGECHYTFDQESDGHSDWVTCVRLSPKLNTPDPIIVSASCDNTVKIWSLSDFRLRFTLQGHKDCVNAVAISPDQTLCASGGKDATIMLWDLEEGSWLRSVEANSTIHALCFSHTRYWICAATETSIQIWDLETKSIVADLRMDPNAESDKTAEGTAITLTNTNKVYCTSLSWSYDGNTLFSGYTDGVIRVWAVERY